MRDGDGSGADWAQLLGRSGTVKTMERFHSFHENKTIVVTGAGGSIGSALSLEIAHASPRLLVLLDACEHGLYQIENRIIRDAGGCAPIRTVLCSVTDHALLDDIFRLHRPDLIYHAAAHKHVPLMEANPFAAIRNNALGTYRLACAARENLVTQVLMISTDKAANPSSMMGASKRIAELVLQSLSTVHTRMNSIRMGNVLGSQGSVVPRFLDQILGDGPVTVACPEVERFFWTMEETVSLIFEAAVSAQGGLVLVPETEEPVSILQLAKYLIQRNGGRRAAEIPIVFTGLRPGDKLRETFVATDERLAGRIGERLHRLHGVSLEEKKLTSLMAELDGATQARNLEELLMVVRQLVPHYTPSSFLVDLNANSLVDQHA